MITGIKYWVLTMLVMTQLLVCAPVSYSQDGKLSSAKKTYTLAYMRSVFDDVDINDAQAAIKVWVREIVKKYRYNDRYDLDAKIYSDYNELNEQIKTDNIAAVSLSTYDYLTYGIRLGLEPAFVPSKNGNINVEYYLITRKKDNYKDIKELKGSRIGIDSEPKHLASKLWLDVTLARNNIPDKKKFFKEMIENTKESQLILNVFFDQLDACVVSKYSFQIMCELNPQVSEKLVSIANSPSYLLGLTCFTKTFNDANERNLFRTDITNVKKLASGKQLFTIIRIDNVVPFQNEYLGNYKNLLKEYNNFIKLKKID